MKTVKIFLLVLILFGYLKAQDKKTADQEKHKITFIELGSDKCVPCIQMQPILKSVKTNYGDQIKVLYYDIWKSDQKQYAAKYKIQLIPTQIFINAEGKELYRHEGFLPEEEIDKFLNEHGLKKIKK